MQGSTLFVVTLLAGYVGSAVVIVLLVRSLLAVWWHAGHDELTGLARRGVACRYVAERRRSGRATTLVLLDLDHFKSVNDTFGHRAGDQLLAEVGARLASQARQMNGCAARLGGDEFLLALPGAGAEKQAVQVGAVLRSLRAPVLTDGHVGTATIRPSATAGVACAADSDWTGLLSAADYALHEAKLLDAQVLYCIDGARSTITHGRNRVTAFRG